MKWLLFPPCEIDYWKLLKITYQGWEMWYPSWYHGRHKPFKLVVA